MKPLWVTLWIASLLGAFALARWMAPGGGPADAPDLETLDAALSQRDQLERTYQLTRFLRQLSPDALPAALAAVEEHRVGVTSDEVRLFMLAWTRFDAPGAFARAREWPTPWRDVLMEEAMHAWGFRDGRAALRECEQIEDEKLRTSLRAAVVSGWVRSADRLGASGFAASVEDATRRNRLGFRIAGEALRDGVDAVVAWADAVPVDAPNSFKQIAFYHAAGVVARADPQRAAQWYQAHMEDSYASTALRNIARKWSRHGDPALLLQWLRSLPLEPDRASERTEAIEVAIRGWADRDPAAAAAWLDAALPDPGLDGAIAEFVRTTTAPAPREALAWASRIVDPDERRMATIRAVREWMRKDAEGARAWLAESELPPGWRQAIGESPRANARRAAAGPRALLDKAR